RYIQLKETLSLSPIDDHELNFGLEVNQYAMQPEKSTPYGENSTVVAAEYSRSTGREMSLFINDEYDLSEKISLSFGLRGTCYQNLGKAKVFSYQRDTARTALTITDTTYYGSNKVIKTFGGLEPRVSARFSITPTSSIKMGYNRLRQYISLISNTTAPTPVDLWQVATPYILPQTGDNFSLGYYRNFKENIFETYLEGFYKKTKNLVEYKDFAQLLRNDHLETELVEGIGKSYGVELFLRKTRGNWTGWIAYTYSRSFVKVAESSMQKNINGGAWYPSNYDKPNAVSIVTNRKVGNNGSFGFNIIYATGRPVSAITSNYNSNGTVVPVFSGRNQYRIPDYLRFDISLTIGDIFKKVKDDLTLSIYNLLGRKNAYSVYYQRLGSTPLPESYKLSLLGSALPSITYNITF
ncbi:MAG: TonB-dependent receptor, partial [Chryseolinea sp.]